jgi:hypothetical protein
MPPARRVDPADMAGWLVRTVAQRDDQPDDVLARLTGTTRAQIAAARTAAIESGARVLIHRGTARLPRANAAVSATSATGPRWKRKAA